MDLIYPILIGGPFIIFGIVIFYLLITDKDDDISKNKA